MSEVDDFAPVESDDWQPINRPPPPTAGEALPEAFMDRLKAGQALGRILGAAGKEASTVPAGTPTGFEDDTFNHLIDLGVFHDPLKGRGGPLQIANEAVMIPTAQAWQAVTRAISMGIYGAGGAAGQAVEEFGGSQGEANRAKNEMINFGNFAMIEGGMGRFARPQVEGGNVMPHTVGTLPAEADFANAAKVLTPEPVLKAPVAAAEVAPDIVTAPTQNARSLGSYMDIAENWTKDPEGTYNKLDALRQEVVTTERELKKKYGVKKVEDLDDADLTPAERNFLFYEKSPTSREAIDEIIQRIQPVNTLAEAAKEIAYEFRRLPTDLSKMNDSEQLVVMRLQVLFSEVGRLGGDLNTVLKEAGSKFAGRFNDPEDALFMAQSAADLLRKMFSAGQEQKAPLQITEQNLRQMWREDGIHPAEAVHDARNDAFLKNEITTAREEIKLDPEIEQVLEETGGKPGSLSAAMTEPGDIPLDVQPPQPPSSLIASAQAAAETLFDVGRDIQMKLAPMARGSVESMATVKDYMNSMRRNAWDWSRIDTDIQKRFTPEQRTRMWNAMDEESLSLRLGEPESARQHQGLATLAPEERAAVVDLDTRQQLAWLRARDLGMVEGEGIAMHAPRMVINIEKGALDREGAMPMNAMGYDLTTRTPGLKHRKYVEVEQTEAAAKAKYGEKAVVARDIRTVALATSQLEDAVAGRTLIENIKDVGKRTGNEVVAEGFRPDPSWITIEHPAFKTWRPKFAEVDGKIEAVKDSAGNTVFEQVPIYVPGDFEGPLRAAMWGKSGAAYQGVMSLKGKTMGLIMNSPMIHNLVEFGRAVPAMPTRIVKAYFDGYRAKNDPAVMHEAIDAGLVPIGKRFFNQDITSVMESPDLTPGRSLTAKALAMVPGWFDEAAGVAVKRAIDKAGDFWHNTLLWDRIADLQAGLYTNFRSDMIAKGMDQQTASRIAAHFANRYAGALPKEAMSEAATKVSNFMMFSRSFTMGNLGVMKDVLTGLPKDVLAQIERDAGFRTGSIEGAAEITENAKTSAASIARRKAFAVVGLDIALMYVGNSVLQSALNVMLGDNTLGEEWNQYLRRFRDTLNNAAVHPLSLINPERYSATDDNEPGRKDRILVGYAKDGTAIYARNPVGKIGEEFSGYFGSPLDMLRKKQGTIARPMMQILSNDAGFGRKVYDPTADTPAKYAGNVWAIVKHIVGSQLPEGQITAFSDLVKGEGDSKVNALQAFGPFAGVTFSKGAPGGPPVGELYAAKGQHQFAVDAAMPDIRKQIRRGDIDGAIGRMTDLGIQPSLQRWYVKSTLNPALRMSPRAIRDFERYSTPEQKDRLDRARQAQPAP